MSTVIPINPTARVYSFTVGEETYRLSFSFNALALAEKLTSTNLLAALDLTNMTLTSLRALLYAVIHKAHPKLTIDDCGDIMERAGIAKTTQAIIECWTLSQPEPDPKDEPEESELPGTN